MATRLLLLQAAEEDETTDSWRVDLPTPTAVPLFSATSTWSYTAIWKEGDRPGVMIARGKWLWRGPSFALWARACEREGGGSRSSPESARSPGGMSSSWVNNQGVPHGYRNLGGRPAARESLADTSTWLCILLLCRRLAARGRSKIPPALAQGGDWNSSYRFRTEREVAKNAWFSIISLRCGFTARGSRNTKCLGHASAGAHSCF
ncbi:hypothetical protein B0H14DRAFT_225613 [Mycena olivaceomarginata]|nr:hypothetical protein B0H14DRAFT_225613 [Mycena olivaceomarginata]